ncbi:MAG: PEP-CTERM sorting domain-containing protein [Cyanobacteria bacterium P01_D01_bin.71]
MRFDLLALGVATLGAVAIAAQPASAAKFQYDPPTIGGNNKAGNHEDINTIFDTNSELLTWSSTFSRNNKGHLADGAWLVLTEGGNPKYQEQEYAIFYLDGIEKKLTAYSYNGQNNSSSYKHNTFLGSWDLDVEEGNDERTFSFALDMTDINSRTDIDAGWKGALFGEKIGVWFHGVTGLETDYDSNGQLTEFTYKKSGWHDVGNKDTEQIPEPALALGLGTAAVIGAVRRKRSA